MIASEAVVSNVGAAAAVVTEGHVAAYQRDGAVRVRDVIAPDQVDMLRDEIEAALVRMGDGYKNHTARNEGASGRFAHMFRMWLVSETLFEFAATSSLVEVAAALMRSEKINLFFDQSFVKEPDTPDATPWHSDQPYWPVRGRQVISTWVALDTITRDSGAVEFVAGSHLWNRWFQPRSFSGENELAINPDYEPVPDIEADRGRYDIVSWDLEPGDVLAFNAMTLHGSPGNSTGTRRRRGYSVRYTGDDVTYDPRPGMTTVLLKEDLVPGKPLDSEHYPVVRRPA